MAARKKIQVTVYLEPELLEELNMIMSKYSIRPVDFRSMSLMAGANVVAAMFEEVGIANTVLMNGLLSALRMAYKSGIKAVMSEEEE